LHTVAATSINSFGCIRERGAEALTGVRTDSGTWILLLVLTLLLLCVALGALYVAWRSWRAAHREQPDEEEELLEVGEGRTRFMAMSGILLSAVFSLLLIANLIALFAVPQCTP
jgi:hypothetical protein